MVAVSGEWGKRWVIKSVVRADHQHHVGCLEEAKATGPAKPIAGSPTWGSHVAHIGDASLAQPFSGDQALVENGAAPHHTVAEHEDATCIS